MQRYKKNKKNNEIRKKMCKIAQIYTPPMLLYTYLLHFTHHIIHNNVTFAPKFTIILYNKQNNKHYEKK